LHFLPNEQKGMLDISLTKITTMDDGKKRNGMFVAIYEFNLKEKNF
jgi:hypothetical protein